MTALIISIVGAILYLILDSSKGSTAPAAQELARLMFWVGLLAFLLK